MKAPVTLARFADKMQAVERSLRSTLEQVRVDLKHSGNKGAKAESTFRRALGEYLPRRLAMGHGEVIDTHGHVSPQCDLVIATDHHPNWHNEHDPSMFLIEGVAGAAEIKVQLTSEHLNSTIDNVKSFRQLQPSWGKYVEVVGSKEEIHRYYRNPPFFLFAYESQLSIETIAKRVSAACEPGVGRRGESLDGVFVLGQGYVLNFGYGKGAFAVRDGAGERLTGYYYDEIDPPLLTLLMWLPLALAVPVSQTPILSEYLLGDASQA